MKLEVVDRRNPMLVRVATVSDTEDYRVKVRGRKVKRWGKRGRCSERRRIDSEPNLKDDCGGEGMRRGHVESSKGLGVRRPAE